MSSLVFAEMILQAARLLCDATAYDEAELSLKRATQLMRGAMDGKRATPELMRRVEAINVASLEIRGVLAAARRAGFRVMRAES